MFLNYGNIRKNIKFLLFPYTNYRLLRNVSSFYTIDRQAHTFKYVSSICENKDQCKQCCQNTFIVLLKW